MKKHNIFLLLLLIPNLCKSGSFDYYECTASHGAVEYSVEPCSRGERQHRVKDDAAPVTIKLDKPTGGLVRLESGAGGNFYSSAMINGVPVRAMVDTGASLVAFSPGLAARTGLDRLPFRWGFTQTANGVARARYIVVDRVDLGGNVVRNVAGSILERDLGRDFDVLLGMSFLKHFELNVAGGVMTLHPR